MESEVNSTSVKYTEQASNPTTSTMISIPVSTFSIVNQNLPNYQFVPQVMPKQLSSGSVAPNFYQQYATAYNRSPNPSLRATQAPYRPLPLPPLPLPMQPYRPIPIWSTPIASAYDRRGPVMSSGQNNAHIRQHLRQQLRSRKPSPRNVMFAQKQTDGMRDVSDRYKQINHQNYLQYLNNNLQQNKSNNLSVRAIPSTLVKQVSLTQPYYPTTSAIRTTTADTLASNSSRPLNANYKHNINDYTLIRQILSNNTGIVCGNDVISANITAPNSTLGQTCVDTISVGTNTDNCADDCVGSSVTSITLNDPSVSSYHSIGTQTEFADPLPESAVSLQKRMNAWQLHRALKAYLIFYRDMKQNLTTNELNYETNNEKQLEHKMKVMWNSLSTDEKNAYLDKAMVERNQELLRYYARTNTSKQRMICANSRQNSETQNKIDEIKRRSNSIEIEKESNEGIQRKRKKLNKHSNEKIIEKQNYKSTSDVNTTSSGEEQEIQIDFSDSELVIDESSNQTSKDIEILDDYCATNSNDGRSSTSSYGPRSESNAYIITHYVHNPDIIESIDKKSSPKHNMFASIEELARPYHKREQHSNKQTERPSPTVTPRAVTPDK